MTELMGAVDWAGKTFSGEWVHGGGETYPAIEPATGRTLGRGRRRHRPKTWPTPLIGLGPHR